VAVRSKRPHGDVLADLLHELLARGFHRLGADLQVREGRHVGGILLRHELGHGLREFA
jgi:hypothetical protein